MLTFVNNLETLILLVHMKLFPPPASPVLPQAPDSDVGRDMTGGTSPSPLETTGIVLTDGRSVVIYHSFIQ